jgi:hypothetical protein
MLVISQPAKHRLPLVHLAEAPLELCDMHLRLFSNDAVRQMRVELELASEMGDSQELHLSLVFDHWRD